MSGAQTILFCNELTNNTLDPILSDTVWCWNDTVAEFLRGCRGASGDFSIQVIGNAEADCALVECADESDELESLKSLANGRQVMVFLSQYPLYSFVDDVDTGPATELSVRWILEAANGCHDWYFAFKTRPYHHGVEVAWLADIGSIENASVLREEIGFRQLMAWDQVRAVGSLISTGLLVAAARERAALRFLPSAEQLSISVLDDVCIPVRSANDLIEALRGPDRSSASRKKFPYRGEVIARMSDISLEDSGTARMA